MPVVTLTTDFGNKDYSVGALKGELLSAFPGFTLVDISHHIKPYNITEAAFVLKNAYPSFPPGTIHIVTVNDQDERAIRFIAAAFSEQFFIGLDNGIFHMVFGREPDTLVELPGHAHNGTRHAYPFKKIFATAAGAIARGKHLSETGIPIASLNQRMSLMSLEPVVQESLIRGTVIHIDAFQNVVVNVTQDLFSRIRNNRSFSISYRSRRSETISAISENYHDVPQGERLCLFNAAGYLEIAINCGEAGSLLGIKTGDYILIDFA